MAMGLGFLGRGNAWRKLYLGSIHILGSAFGGAVVGSLLGWIGTYLPLSVLSSCIIIAVTSVFALWQALSRRPATLGLHRQVPRRWGNIMPAGLCYLLWGIMLGSGITTIIPYSAFLIVLATQITSGVATGCLSGLLFGGTRGIVSLLPLFSRQNPATLPKLLPTLTIAFQRLNLLWIIAGSLLLGITVWH